MRPRTVIWFERLLLASLLGPLLHAAASWEGIRTGVVPMRVVVVTLLLSVVIPFLLTLRISRSRSSIAKWTLVVLFAIGMPGWLLSLVSNAAPGLLFAIGLATAALQAAAIALLFTASARAWLSRSDMLNSPQALRRTFD